jgi:hypothetical protein
MFAKPGPACIVDIMKRPSLLAGSFSEIPQTELVPKSVKIIPADLPEKQHLTVLIFLCVF